MTDTRAQVTARFEGGPLDSSTLEVYDPAATYWLNTHPILRPLGRLSPWRLLGRNAELIYRVLAYDPAEQDGEIVFRLRPGQIEPGERVLPLSDASGYERISRMARVTPPLTRRD